MQKKNMRDLVVVVSNITYSKNSLENPKKIPYPTEVVCVGFPDPHEVIYSCFHQDLNSPLTLKEQLMVAETERTGTLVIDLDYEIKSYEWYEENILNPYIEDEENMMEDFKTRYDLK